MQVYFPPKGLIVELVNLEEKLFLEHLKAIKKMADAVMLLSPEVGDGLNLTVDQKKELISLCAEAINGELPLMIFITGDTEEETVENMLEFESLLKEISYPGKVFWVDAPLYYHSNRGLPDMYNRFFSITSYPFILYNNAKLVEKVKGPFNRRNIRTSILKELSFEDRIKGLIFFGDLRRALNYQKAVMERPSFRIYDGDEKLFLNFPNKNGLVSVSANVIPQVWKNMLYREHEEGKGGGLYLLLEFLDLLKEGGTELIKVLIKGSNLTSEPPLVQRAKELVKKLQEEGI
jgi:dihydrodipicolinate synthase/N-acetylneuraminate lyase